MRDHLMGYPPAVQFDVPSEFTHYCSESSRFGMGAPKRIRDAWEKERADVIARDTAHKQRTRLKIDHRNCTSTDLLGTALRRSQTLAGMQLEMEAAGDGRVPRIISTYADGGTATEFLQGGGMLAPPGMARWVTDLMERN